MGRTDRLSLMPAAVLEAVRGMAAPLAGEKGLWLRVRLDASVPVRVCGDAQRLRQVRLNLVNNAVKFTRTGGVAVTLEASPVEAGWRLDCRVRDSGIGIPAGLQRRLFQEFTQVDGSIARRFGGTGPGLAISHRLIGAMGAKIAVETGIDVAGIDRAALDELADTLGEAAIAEIITAFLAAVGEQIDRLRALAAAARRLEHGIRESAVDNAVKQVAAIEALTQTARTAPAGPPRGTDRRTKEPAGAHQDA